MKYYADIVLPLAVPTTYTYSVADAMVPHLKVGMLVSAPLQTRFYNGIVVRIHNEGAENIKYKDIAQILLKNPIVTQQQIELWSWISSYYMCKMGYVLKVAIPVALFNTSYRARTQLCVRLSVQDWMPLFNKRKPTAQQVALLEYLFEHKDGVSLADAQQVSSASVISLLEKKGVIEKFETEVSRFCYSGVLQSSSELSTEQSRVYYEITSFFVQDSKPVLLHGITSSGKTEIYIKLIEKALEKGKQVLFLVPEIALTTQLTKRLELIFGDILLVYHSKLNDQERAEVYNEVLSGESYKIVLGVRSAVFLPFKDLGLVIVDEQHDQSYKQQEPQPLYSAVSCAAVLAQKYGANMVLGSATPSVEGYYNAVTGKWHLVELQSRYNNIQPPEIEIVDMRAERRKKKIQSMFSWTLRDRIISAVEAGEQVILFHNRRGYASQIHCDTCGWVPTCDACSVSLTYHKSSNTLECHYCGRKSPMPAVCPVCGGEISSFGYGTEQVEDVIKEFLPDARVLRLDLDTTKGKGSYNKILGMFAAHEADILLGTQMVSKGLDFENVSLVGVVDADTMIDYPDFRSTEMSFQTLLQVSGRSGRAHKQGSVLIQTSHADYPIVEQVVNADYKAFYEEQIGIRRLFKYPPFCRIVFITLKSKYLQRVLNSASWLVNHLNRVLAGNVYGPEIPPVSKINDYNIRRVMVKIPADVSLGYAKAQILRVLGEMDGVYPNMSVAVDVDPV